jgi:hypothetical protein
MECYDRVNLMTWDVTFVQDCSTWNSFFLLLIFILPNPEAGYQLTMWSLGFPGFMHRIILWIKKCYQHSLSHLTCTVKSSSHNFFCEAELLSSRERHRPPTYSKLSKWHGHSISCSRLAHSVNTMTHCCDLEKTKHFKNTFSQNKHPILKNESF